jgi:hypothetical protein
MGIAAPVCYHACSGMPSVEPTSRGAGVARAHPLSLRGLLLAQPEATLTRLLGRRRAELDPHKRLDAHEQAARALATVPRSSVEALSATAREALEALVPAPGWRPRRELGGGSLALVEAGLALSLPLGELDVLALPAAYRLQLAAPRAESRHAARALLATLDTETREDIALTLRGRRSSLAWPLAIEDALLRLETPAELDRLLGEQDRAALLALSAIEARGGEVSLDEYLDLCREPARWSGARIPRRGAAFQLVSHALVLPSGEGRLVMPEEVAARVGRDRRATLEQKRAAAIDQTARREDEPQRASHATPRGPRALAAWLEATSLEGAARSAGRGAISRAARHGAASFDQTLLLVTLAQATPLRGHTLASYGRALFSTWRSGHAWDELLETPRVLDAQLETPTVVLRKCALDALASLPAGRFASREQVRAAIESDLRFDGVRSAFERGRQRRGAAWVTELAVAIDRLLDVSLPALGLVDVAPDGSMRASMRALMGEGGIDEGGAEPPTAPAFTADRIRFAPTTPIELLGALAGTVDAVADDAALVVRLEPTRVPLDVRDRWLAALDRAGHPDVPSLASQCVQPRGRARAQRASLLVTLPTRELADEVRAAPSIQRHLVDPQPDGPFLLFDEDASRAAIVRALGRLGVTVELAPRAEPAPRGRRRIR